MWIASHSEAEEDSDVSLKTVLGPLQHTRQWVLEDPETWHLVTGHEHIRYTFYLIKVGIPNHQTIKENTWPDTFRIIHIRQRFKTSFKINWLQNALSLDEDDKAGRACWIQTHQMGKDACNWLSASSMKRDVMATIRYHKQFLKDHPQFVVTSSQYQHKKGPRFLFLGGKEREKGHIAWSLRNDSSYWDIQWNSNTLLLYLL